MASDKIVPFFIPWITEEDKKAVLEALSSRWLTGGQKVRQFEEMFAEYIGTKYAIAVSNCTAALHLVMRALNLRQGDEVIVPVLTFAATANAPIYCGAKPIFADIDEKTMNISPDDLLNKITDRSRAIIVVHYAGQPCDMREIMEIAEDHKLFVVEDCAHSLGATYMNKKTGSIGVAGCFSFYPTKNITTLEGGMITTDDSELARKLRLLREHCMTKTALEREMNSTWVYDIIDLGYNYRLNEVQAALGISQLGRIDEINRRRITAAQYYNEGLSGVRGIVKPYVAENRTHVYNLYVIRVIEEEYGLGRDELFRCLSAKGIGLSVHYRPLHLLKFYRTAFNYRPGDFPIAERLSKEILSLPLFPLITKEQIGYVVDKIRECGRNSW
ncbi:MAG: DegT/DnrJ/EryC1/StrS family aminotransferase [Candidatus Bathyarchaeia archaeon]